MNRAEETCCISFVLKSEVTPEQRLNFQRRWEQATHEGAVVYLSDAPQRRSFRVGHIRVPVSASAKVLDQLEAQPEVENAQIEVPRKLS